MIGLRIFLPLNFLLSKITCTICGKTRPTKQEVETGDPDIDSLTLQPIQTDGPDLASPILQTTTGSSTLVDKLAETGSSPLSGKLKSFLKDLIYDESTDNEIEDMYFLKKLFDV